MEKILEKAPKIKIIFFDIDDTLRVKDSAFMPESITEVFYKLREKGIMTGIATGRNLFGVVPEVRALKPDFYVAINGAYVENAQTGEVLYKNTFSKELINLSTTAFKAEITCSRSETSALIANEFSPSSFAAF